MSSGLTKEIPMKYQSQTNPDLFFVGCTRGEDRCITAVVKTVDSKGNLIKVDRIGHFFTYGLKRRNVQAQALRSANSVAKIRSGAY
jgi:hypothetical protein